MLSGKSYIPRALTNGFGVGRSYLVLSTIFINVLSLSLPMLTLQVYDRIIPNPDSGTLPVLIGGVAVAVLLDTLLRLARAYMIGWNGVCYEHALSCQAVDHMLAAELAAYQGTGTGEHLSRLAAIPRLKDFKSGVVLITLLELIFVPVFLGLIAFIAGPLVIVPLTILAFFVVISLWYGHSLKKSLRIRDRADDRRYDFLIESLEGIHTIKSFSLEDKFARRYERLENNSTLANHAVTENSSKTFNAAAICSHAMTAGVITFGATLALGGHITSGILIASILLSGRIMQPAQRVLSLWARYQDYAIARDKVSRIFALPHVQRAELTADIERQGRVELRDAGLFRAGSKDFLFRHVNLAVSRGQAVRISGVHGSGKSALLRLIAGLYVPDEGQVLLDGVNAHDYPADIRMQHVGFMTTKAVMFRGTIRDNITRFGLVSEESAREISARLGIVKEVSALPRGFDTFLEGTETDAIPPGLRQRIALARVLAAKPRVILFDNADRNLDRDGYRQVYELLGKLREKTALILVTDDMNIGRLADRNFVLDESGLTPAKDFPEQFSYGELSA